MIDFRKKKCPKCGRKGLHYAMHPHAYGHKDYGQVECRFCHTYFQVPTQEEGRE